MAETVGEQQACPVCDTAGIADDAYRFDGMCTACGFVIHDSAEKDITPDWVRSDESTTNSEQDSWQEFCRITNATEEQLAAAFETIEDFADQLPLPADIREAAAQVYGSAFNAELTDGRATESMVAACVRAGSIQADKPIPTRRLTGLKPVSDGTFRSCYRDLQEEIDLPAGGVSPEAYLWFFDQAMSVSKSPIDRTREELQSISGANTLIGKDPVGIAAAALYRAGETITQQTVAEVAGVSTETIRLRAADIREVAE